MNTEIPKIAVIGLGYVGLPLARLFATKYPVIGFDINAKRVEELQKGHDSTLEVEDEVLQQVLLKKYPLPIEMPSEVEEMAIAGHWETPTHFNGSSEKAKSSSAEASVDNQPTTGLYISRDLGDIQDCNYYIITVPTPVDKNNRPDLTPLYKASESVGKVLKKGDIVIYESTVYPGATEEECVPVLEEKYGPNITIYDPWANPVEVMHEYGLESTNELPQQKFDAVVLAVAHQEFLQIDLHPLKKEKAVVYDVKAILKNPDGRL